MRPLSGSPPTPHPPPSRTLCASLRSLSSELLLPRSLGRWFVALPMRTALCVHTFVSKAEPLHRPSAHQVLLHNFFSVFRLHVPVPDGIGIHHHRGPVLALVQASGLVDAHFRAQAGLT